MIPPLITPKFWRAGTTPILEKTLRESQEKNPPEKKPPKIKKFIWTSFCEQFPSGSWLASQGRRQKFARTFRKSSRERGVFLVFWDFGWVFGPLENEGANENLSFGFPSIPGIAPGVAPRIVVFVLLKSWDATPRMEFRIPRMEFRIPRVAPRIPRNAPKAPRMAFSFRERFS